MHECLHMEKKHMIFLNQIINIRIKALFFIQLFFQAVCAIISVFPVLLIRDIVDLAAYGEKQNIRKIIYIGCFYLGIQIFHGLLSALTKYLSSWLQANISLTLEGHIFHHISKVNLQAIKFSICELEDIIRHHKGPIGENGICLSGGERKRVLIARTIADYDSDLFIFDEMSASLDHDTFLRIWNRVDHYLKAKSRVYIEHNRSIQKLVDCVIDVDSRFRVADLHN